MPSECNLNSTRASYNAKGKENCMSVFSGVLCSRCPHLGGPAVSPSWASGASAQPRSPQGLLATTAGMEYPAAVPWDLLRGNSRPQEGDRHLGHIPVASLLGVSSTNWELPALGVVPQGCAPGDAPNLPYKNACGCPYCPIPTPRFPNLPPSGAS